ncbi:macrolide family glycosyltransferase [Amycolatopsis sp. CA-128772]|uniref:macrolide family glycosyltransferase n=1 Tax=Amycolatopsis sp. CA-128772 TaxID=2073159 RepID=UPI000CD31EF1|nr:macrolide family glycosyltransferase [Amycolatopsis sp. CA-128772]
MAHIALLNIPAYGHVMPTLDVAAELVRRGHRVTFATTDQFADLVAATGAQVLRYESSLTPKPRTEDPPADFAAWLPLVLVMESTATIPVFEAAFAGDVPDLILYDRTVYATGRVLAAKWGVPAVELFPSFAYNDHWSLAKFLGEENGFSEEHPARVAFREKIAALTAAHGVPAISPADFAIGREEFAVAFVAKEFQYHGETFDDHFAFVGPCLGDRTYQGGWQPPSDGRPVLLVSLGTAFNDRPEFFRAVVTAFTGEDWHVVLSIGALDPATLGELPPNVEAHAHLPQLTVLEHASAFLTHSGMGGTMEALYFDTPMVTLPQSVEQAAVAHRVAELGLGTNLAGQEPTPELLRTAVRSTAADGRIRAAVAAMGARVRAAGGAARAADELERHLKHAS